MFFLGGPENILTFSKVKQQLREPRVDKEEPQRPVNKRDRQKIMIVNVKLFIILSLRQRLTLDHAYARQRKFNHNYTTIK